MKIGVGPYCKKVSRRCYYKHARNYEKAIKITKKRLSKTNSRLVAWLLATEGSVGLMGNKHPTSRRNITITPYIAFWNTDKELVDNFKAIIKNGKKYERKRNEKWSTEYQLRVLGVPYIISVLESIIPFAPSKKFECLCGLVQEFCNLRFNRERYKTPYAKRELQIYKEVRRLNHR